MTRANQISGRAYLTNGRAIGGSAIPDAQDLYTLVENQYLIDNYVDGGNVNQWDGNIQNTSFTQSNSAEQPTFDADGANGVAAAVSDGSDDSLAATGLNTLDESNGFVAYVYFSAPSQSGFGGLIGPNVTSTRGEWLIRRNGVNDTYDANVDFDNVGTEINGESASNVEDGNRHSLILSETGGTATLYFDGSSVGSLDVSSYSFSTSSLRLFKYEAGGSDFYINSNMVEAGIYSVGKDAQTASDIHNYLVGKY